MAAVIVLVLALSGSALANLISRDLLPPVVIDGQRVAPNIPSVQPFPAISPQARFGNNPVFSSQATLVPRPVSDLTPPAVDHRTVFRIQPTFGSQPVFVVPPQNVRLQSDFVPVSQAINTPLSFQTQTAFGPQQNFRINDEFVSPPTHQRQQITVTNRVHQLDGNGDFSSTYETSDGQRVTETGQAHPTPDGLGVVLAKSGSYSYYSPEGVPVSVRWDADESGFRASGTTIPK